MNMMSVAARVAARRFRVGEQTGGDTTHVGSSWGNTPEVEEAIYGHSGGEKDPDKQGSSIWWLVFNEIGVEDWTPLTNYNAIEQKAKDLLAEWSKDWGSLADPKPDPAVQAKDNEKRITESLQELKKNWDSYQKNYMPEHINILKQKGLM